MDWKTELVKVVFGALALMGTWALKNLAAWLDAKKHESKLMAILSTLPHMAEVVYEDVKNQLSIELQTALADGKIDDLELKNLRASAVEALKISIAKHGLSTLKEAFGPLLDLVLTKIMKEVETKIVGSTVPK